MEKKTKNYKSANFSFYLKSKRVCTWIIYLLKYKQTIVDCMLMYDIKEYKIFT